MADRLLHEWDKYRAHCVHDCGTPSTARHAATQECPVRLRAVLDEARAEVGRLRGLLRRVEWQLRSPWLPSDCPVCGGQRPHHSPDCELAAALEAPDGD